MFRGVNKRIGSNPSQVRCFENSLRAVSLAALLITTLQLAHAQGFNSGSNGSDGALNLTTPGTVVFDPKSFNPALDPDGDNIYHFTTINIASGVTVKLSGRVLNGPVFWLAQGNVTINGTIDLKGEDGPSFSMILAGRTRAMPGAGGFSGGIGGKSDGSAASPTAQPGDGPAGGQGATIAGDPFGACRNQSGSGGSFVGNSFSVPLIGGSGGGGGNGYGNQGNITQTHYGSAGGGGGGALLIASSTSITVNGNISANGGNGGTALGFCNNSASQPTGAGGGGAGGAIRLVASTLSGDGNLSSLGGNAQLASQTVGSNGAIRLEALNYNFAGNFNGTPFTTGSPFNLFLPTTPPPAIKVVSVNGVNVTQPPTGNVSTPDVTINTNSAVQITIQASNIPLGTVLSLKVFSDNNTDQFVQTTPLQGTVQSSTATATIALPGGFSLSYVKATWIQ